MPRRKGTVWLQWIGIPLICIWLQPLLVAQRAHPLSNIHYYTLTTAEGLTDNYVSSMAIDQNGYLWLGTGEGLNRFDGNTVDKYYVVDHPALHNDVINQVVCDKEDRLWISSGTGFVTLIDQQRRFHWLGLYDDQKFIRTRKIISTEHHGILLFTKDKHLQLKDNIDLRDRDSLTLQDFNIIHITGEDTLAKYTFEYVDKGHGDQYWFSNNKRMYVVDYDKLQLLYDMNCPYCKPMEVWDDKEILFYDKLNNSLETMDPVTHVRTPRLRDVKDQHGKPLIAYIHDAAWINENQLMMTSRYEGVFFYDKRDNTLFNYIHNAADPTSIPNNIPIWITVDPSGWVFFTALPNGTCYFNQHAVIGQQLVFQDDHSHTYDGYISKIETVDNDTYYICGSEYLIEWKRSTNASRLIEFPLDAKLTENRKDQVTNARIDRFGRLWVSSYASGFYVFDKNFHIIHHFSPGPEGQENIFNSVASHINESPDGYMWICSNKSIYRINEQTFEVKELTGTAVEKLADKKGNRVEFFEDGFAWICTSNYGAWKYDYRSDTTTQLTKKSGLLSNEVFCINKDRKGNYYFGSELGMTILLTNGKVKYFNDHNGLLNKRVEALLLDKHDRMWFGNDVAIGCINLADTTVRMFDERYGLSVQGFRLNSYHQNSDDELIWGTERGIQYFYPDDMMAQSVHLRTTINKIECRDLNTYLTSTDTFTLAPGNNYLSFHFTSIDFTKHLHNFFQYQLTGIDPDWVTIQNQNEVRYNSLKPGTYTFRVRASNDRKTWENAENNVTIVLRAYLWDRIWFRWLAFLMIGGLVYWLFSRLNKKQKVRTEAIETESVINYFASQINRNKHIDDVLWDVAKNCISKLNLDECVIYLVDKNRQVLVQKAAYGPKTIEDRIINDPIEIKVGHGITGTVAATQKPEIINNTEKDPRYIIDDVRRYSEIAVPIIVDGEVIGVIDSENAQRNFFTTKHLSLMTTIAILTANHIQRIQAEEEKQKAEIEILQNRQKATESRLQSLRLQMNPHFLFNALNSIQQMILANEEMVATRYLSRFSKLLRSILIHSDKEMISLKEELDILKLYVELESVRFKEAFTYDIVCDVDIDADEVKIPTLLIQPFVENAIWHGLMHKEGMRNLRIEFTEEGDAVRCVVEDNGIGRTKAKEMKLSTGKDKQHTSKGIAVSMERLKSMQKNGGQPGSLFIHDLVDEHGHPVGTRVEIILPIQN